MLSSLKSRNKLFYGWVMVATFFVVGAILMGIRLTFGVFFKSIEIEFDLTRTVTSAVFSAHMAFSCVSVLMWGWASDRYGPRIVILLMGLITGISLLLTSQTVSLWQLFTTYSLLLAMGTAAVFVVTISTLSKWFDRKRGLALGITGSGIGLGTMVIAPFAAFVISNLDWRMAYLILGLIALLIVIPASFLLKKDPHEIGGLPDGVEPESSDQHIQQSSIEEKRIQSADLSLMQVLRTRSFRLIIFSWLLYGSTLNLIFTHIVPHATDTGMSPAEAATILSVIGGSSIVGRVLWGIASDKIGRKVSLIICSLLQFSAVAWLIWSQELWAFYVFALVYGFAYAGMYPAMGSLISDMFGLSKIGAVIGVLEFGFIVGATVGPILGGFIFDVSDSYNMAFLIGALNMLIVALFIALAKQETRRKIGVRLPRSQTHGM